MRFRRLLGRLAQKLSPWCPYRKYNCPRTLYEGMRGRCIASDCPIRPKDRKRSTARRNIGKVDWEYLDAERR